ncbi:MAG: hypothetical protein ACP5E3_16585 [Bacteroidales bacterium]
MKIETKKLEIQPEKKGLKGLIKSRQFRRSIVAILIGAIAGVGFFYLTEGINMASIEFGEILNSALIGAFFGFFITNSPCARNRC